MAASASPSERDCCCSVCCDIFNDPVVLLCGHSFCTTCLREWWRQSHLQTCPTCNQTFPTAKKPPRNLALRNVSDALRREKNTQSANRASEKLCGLHGEKFTLYCATDQQLICLSCRDAKQHKKHNCVPIEEAVDTFRAQLKLKRLHLHTKQNTFTAHHVQCRKMADHIKLQAQQTEDTLKKEFQRLRHFLRAEEAARIEAVRKEAKFKSDAIDIRIINLTAEISSLGDKIKAIQKEMKADDIALMLNAKSTMER
ncbi:Tripartite motif-containing protein 35 [Liparis tanakae]|uniref:Tripartite motif-containing protein 35 n=1 Tax=Liparis tanakae TaxID=230148 RepID=A0A4Z2IXQ9_9TELE|nr:Tripartite motif-containing protein 35 [Liparis tanakae]